MANLITVKIENALAREFGISFNFGSRTVHRYQIREHSSLMGKPKEFNATMLKTSDYTSA